MGGTICRIYERTDHGVHVIAQIRGGRVTGKQAGSIRKLLKQFGFPHAPLEAVIDQLLLSRPNLGAAIIPSRERNG
jgi:hypothetical protein